MTGSDSERATFFLESSNWNVDVAVSSFFENDGDVAAAVAAGEDDVVPMEAPPPPPTNEEEGSGQRGSAAPGARGVGPNVAGLAGFAAAAAAGGNESDSDSEDDPGQAFYAGGSTSSGQQILGPPKKGKKKEGASFVKDVFKKAREAGAEQLSEASTSRGAGQQSAFTGTGFKLGSSESDPSQKVEGAKKAKVMVMLFYNFFPCLCSKKNWRLERERQTCYFTKETYFQSSR